MSDLILNTKPFLSEPSRFTFGYSVVSVPYALTRLCVRGIAVLGAALVLAACTGGEESPNSSNSTSSEAELSSLAVSSSVVASSSVTIPTSSAVTTISSSESSSESSEAMDTSSAETVSSLPNSSAPQNSSSSSSSATLIWETDDNLALGKAATQIGIWDPHVAGHAVDGDMSTMSHSDNVNNAWWQVDLGEVVSISEIDIYNRTNCCSERLTDFYILVSKEPFVSQDLQPTLDQAGVFAKRIADPAESPSTYELFEAGRYLRIQLVGKNFLHMKEVVVRGFKTGVAPLITGVADGAELSIGSSLEISVLTTDDDQVQQVDLFLNDDLVRREGVAPFDWNHADLNQDDSTLQNLAGGEYRLRAVVTSKNGTQTASEVSFSVIENIHDQALKVFEANNCTNAGCHSASPGGAHIDLVTGSIDDFAARLVGISSGKTNGCKNEKVIDHLDAANSLFLKVTDSNSGDQCLAKMPFGKPGVTDAEFSILQKWIDKLIEIAPPVVVQPADPTRIETIALNKTTGFSVASYAKKILRGDALNNNEYNRIVGGGSFDANEYDALLREWIASDKFDFKIRQFLRMALQQNASPLTMTDYWEQLGGLGYEPDAPVDTSRTQRALHEMMTQTALRIINSEEDFRTILTTRDWEVSTIILAALGRADQQQMSENSDEFRLHGMPGVIDSDYEDWRTIRMVQGSSRADYEKSENYIQRMRAKKDGDTYELLAPRVGFFTSPAFIYNWETNPSNQFRLTLNQTLISALALSFEAGDTTARNHEEGIFAEHAKPGTDCHACHSQMDPMRNVFLKYYHSENTRALKSIGNQRPDFSFHGLTREVANMDEFAQALADHPNFAFAWASKVCQWVTSVECEKKYPEDVQDIADEFKRSGYNFKTLLVETLKSPLVMNGITDNSEMLISIARQDHWCTHLEGGLEAISEKHGRGKNRTFCDKSVHWRTAQTDLVPNDEYTRGKESLLQPSALDPFYLKSVEYLCSDRDWWFIGNNNNVPFRPDRMSDVLDDMVQIILGIPSTHDHYSQAREGLERTFNVLRKSPQCNNPSDVNIKDNANPSCGYALTAQKATETLWKMVCSAPSTTSVGIGF